MWQNVDKSGILFHLFPENSTSSLQHLIISWTSRIRFSLHPWKRQVAIGINRVDLLDIAPLDEHEITFAKPLQFIVDLIFDPAFAFLGLTVILLVRLPGTKLDVIHIVLWCGDYFASPKGCDTQWSIICVFGKLRYLRYVDVS
jgi:hypothetical protein